MISNLGISNENIKNGIQKINNLARLQEINSGKLKELVKNNLFLISGDHNEDGARAYSIAGKGGARNCWSTNAERWDTHNKQIFF